MSSGHRDSLVRMAPKQSIEIATPFVTLRTLRQAQCSAQCTKLRAHNEGFAYYVAERGAEMTFLQHSGTNPKEFTEKGKAFPIKGKALAIKGKPFAIKGKPFSIEGKPFPTKGKAFPIKGKPFFTIGKAFSIKGKRFLTKGKALAIKGKAFFIKPKPFKHEINLIVS